MLTEHYYILGGKCLSDTNIDSRDRTAGSWIFLELIQNHVHVFNSEIPPKRILGSEVGSAEGLYRDIGSGSSLHNLLFPCLLYTHFLQHIFFSILFLFIYFSNYLALHQIFE